ncbi:FtsX-like permease family protein [Actinospica robiniae]|uniref:FtsX-like permease family protein n=1 Tax=Actinospica robiniae TaxID=304901 RepID=UPI000685DB66
MRRWQMLRMTVEQLRRRWIRALAVVAGVLVAVTGFTVLTGSVSTQRAQLNGLVQANSRGAYDLLVRPSGSETALETQRGLVRGNYLSGQYGGITTAQWHQIQQLSGVQVAAPVAMLGYVPIQGTAYVDATAQVDPRLTQQVVKVSNTWVTDRGLTKIPDPGAVYVYVTKNPVVWPQWRDTSNPQDGTEYVYQGRTVSPDTSSCGVSDPSVPVEVLPSGAFTPICAAGGLNEVNARPAAVPTNQYTSSVRTSFSVARLNPDGTFTTDDDFNQLGEIKPTESARLVAPVPWLLSLLVAAIDPQSEDQMVALDHAVTAGSPLTSADKPEVDTTAKVLNSSAQFVSVPLLLSDSGNYDEQLSAAVQTFADQPVVDGAPTSSALSALAKTTATTRTTQSYDANSVYARTVLPSANLDPSYTGVLGNGLETASGLVYLNPRIQSGQTSYSASTSGILSPHADGVADAQKLWPVPGSGLTSVDASAVDNPYAQDYTTRALSEVGNLPSSDDVAGFAVGEYDPAKLRQFSQLSSVALETFQPTTDTGGNTSSTGLLDGRTLGADSNPGGYVATPPQLLTTMAAVPYILDSSDPQQAAPISEVQIRVSGITGVDASSANRLAAVAKEIEDSTGLSVDIVAGSSPTTVTVDLPAGRYGRPALTLSEQWSRKGVAAVLVNVIDDKSMMLFLLVLLVCVLFVADAVAASVRARRTELAILACLGWTGRRLAALILGEAFLLAGAAGLLGAALAKPIGAVTGVHISVLRSLTAIPLALAVAAVAAAVPALRAARSHPGEGLRPHEGSETRRGRAAARRGRGQVRSTRMLAWRWTLRTPGRTAASISALALGIGAVGVLVGIDTAFHASSSGSLLGAAVGVRVRGVDEAAAAITLVLSLLAAADVIYLGAREREAELASLRAAGWTDRDIRSLILWEGAVVAPCAAVLGAILGAAATQLLVHTVPVEVYAALGLLAVLALAITLAACLIPARLAARAPLAQVLVAE